MSLVWFPPRSIIHPKSEKVCGFSFLGQKNLRKKCVSPHDKILRHKCVNHSNSMIFDKRKEIHLSKAFFQNEPGIHKCLLNMFCKTFHYTLVFKDASWPLLLTYIAELIVFAFSDNLSAENSKSSAVSGNQRNQLFGCMVLKVRNTHWVSGKEKKGKVQDIFDRIGLDTNIALIYLRGAVMKPLELVAFAFSKSESMALVNCWLCWSSPQAKLGGQSEQCTTII